MLQASGFDSSEINTALGHIQQRTGSDRVNIGIIKAMLRSDPEPCLKTGVSRAGASSPRY